MFTMTRPFFCTTASHNAEDQGGTIGQQGAEGV